MADMDVNVVGRAFCRCCCRPSSGVTISFFGGSHQRAPGEEHASRITVRTDEDGHFSKWIKRVDNDLTTLTAMVRTPGYQSGLAVVHLLRRPGAARVGYAEPIWLARPNQTVVLLEEQAPPESLSAELIREYNASRSLHNSPTRGTTHINSRSRITYKLLEIYFRHISKWTVPDAAERRRRTMSVLSALANAITPGDTLAREVLIDLGSWITPYEPALR